jgi:hypothetical protein
MGIARKVACKFAATAKIARGRDANNVGPRFSQMLFGGLEKLSGPVQVSPALRLAPHLHAPQNLGLQQRPQALDLLQAALAGGFL